MKNKYETSDFCLAASLLCKGFNPTEIKNIPNTRKVVFIFDDSSSLQVILKEFWSKSLLVNPQDFNNSQKFLKSSIYERQSYAA
jgi:hypothetical protein